MASAEEQMINAVHEAWHCAAALEMGQRVNHIELQPRPGTSWGDREENPADDFTIAVITLVPNIALLPLKTSADDQQVLDGLDARVVERARPEAARLVNDVINRSGVAAVARKSLYLGFIPGDSATRAYHRAKGLKASRAVTPRSSRRAAPGPRPR